MNAILPTPPSSFQAHNSRYTPSRPMSFSVSSSAGKKRKAGDEDLQHDERMLGSPSPNIPSRSFHPQRSVKRPRSGVVGRPLGLPRLLETLDADSLRGVLQTICSRNPSIGAEVENTAPRPGVSSALAVLKNYEATLQSSFPFGGDATSDYAYNRVRQALLNLLEALADFTPHFLPPNETQATQSLSFLDGATDIIHRLPNWQNFQNSLHKQHAYEEISQAWTLAIREAAKRAGGMQLQYGGWDQKIMKHNQQADGKLQEAVNELNTGLGWMGGQQQQQQSGGRGDDVSSVRQELLNGTYGSSYPVRVGPW